MTAVAEVPSLFHGEDDPFLRRDDGTYFKSTDLPCTDLPHLWDFDATAAERREAQRLCNTECPARAQCYAKRLEIKTRATGVWGGIIIRRTKKDEAPGHDPLVQQWAAKYGVPLPTEGNTDNGR